MFSQLENIKGKFIEVGKTLSDPAATQDMKRFAQLNKEYRELEKVVNIYERYKLVLGNIDTNRQILNTESDEEFRELAKNDLAQLETDKEKIEDELRTLLVPKEPEDDRDILLEIRAGTGGDEAGIFAGDLARMYTR